MKETIEHNNRFYGEELKTESEQLKEWLIVANKEIERLNKKIKQYEDPEDMTLMFMWCDEKAKDEIKRLNNIINEFDKWLENEIKFQEIVENAHFLRKARIKLQELKGSDNNE